MKTKLRSFRELIAWQKAMQLLASVDELTRVMPASRRYIVFQLQRAALSVPTNIAEGYGRGSRAQYLQFLSIALGSLREVQALLAVHAQTFGPSPKLNVATALADEAGRVLFSLQRSLQRRRTPEP